MLITGTTKLSEAIHDNYLLLTILNRFDIHLGFGEKTVEQICKEQKMNQEFFLEIVNSFLDRDYFPQSELQSFPLTLILNYINRSHNYYIGFKLPQIEGMINNLIQKTSEVYKKQYQLMANFFQQYKNELIEHIENEEINVHPYIIEIDSAFQENTISKEIVTRVKKESISNYVDDHDNVEDKLFDLKNLIIKYLPPAGDYTLSNAILFELFRLERDLNDHARIEEKVLVPKVELLEKQIVGA